MVAKYVVVLTLGIAVGLLTCRLGEVVSTSEESAVVQTSDSHSKRVLVATELSPLHVWQFLTMLYPSWEALGGLGKCPERSSDQPDPAFIVSTVIVDLFIACEPSACDYLPSACVEYTPSQNLIPKDTSQPRCMFAIVQAEEGETYRFAHSLHFLVKAPMKDIVRNGPYTFIMRSDTDAVLFPGMNSFLPRYDGVVGDGFCGTEYTFAMLETFAEKEMGIKIKLKTNGLQSTFIVHRSVFLPFVQTLVNSTRFIYNHAFSNEMCDKLKHSQAVQAIQAEKEKERIEKEKSKGVREKPKEIRCRWPHWHDGVSSLYGTLLAVNKELTKPLTSTKLDVFAAPRRRIDYSLTAADLMQAHLIFPKHFMEDTMAKGELCTNETGVLTRKVSDSAPFFKEFQESLLQVSSTVETLHCKMPIREYMARVVLSSNRQACAALRLRSISP